MENKELFNNKTKEQPAQRQPMQLGLYDATNEHDACGVGMLVNIHGSKSHELVESALKVLENMRHRGAEGADNKTGDGAGIMLQIPHEFILLQGIPVPEKGKYGTGLLFLPKDEKDRAAILSIIIEEIEKEGLTLMHLRNVPTCPEILGEAALANEPDIKQIFITGFTDSETADRRLYIIRKRIENKVRRSDIAAREDFYIVSLSTKNIIYKGMLSSLQLRNYFPDLTNNYFTSGLALVHSRFSTNTFPTWGLAQPFRLLAHNGEINTIRGNRGWMEARESVLSSPALGDIKELRPIIQPNMSDSASLDNVLEFLVMSGLSLPHAMAMLVPESFNEKNPISEDLKAFYEYHSILMEPWDGPAALLFSDGRYAGGMLDRNGLRPARYLITHNDIMVVASEVGVMDFEPGDIKEKGRLQPGKILLIDTEKGEIYYDGEQKKQLAEAKPYRTWLASNRIELNELKSGRKVPHNVDNYNSMLRTFGFSKEDVEKIILPMASNGAEPVSAMGNDTPLAVLSDKPQLLYNYFRQQFAQVTNPPIDPIREELVMSLTEYIGAVGMNILTPNESHCKMVRLNHPILTNAQLDILCNIRYKGFKTVKLPILFEVSKGRAGLQEALDRLCKEAEESVTEGVNYIVLTDRNVDTVHAAIPSLLAVSAVHHHLISVGKRVQTALVVESGEIREVMHAALLLGFGASALNPYMAFAVLNELVAKKEVQLDYATAEKNYIKAICKGLFKIMSKMGISTIRSYRGAKIFEAVGLSKELSNAYFGGLKSAIGGIRLDEVARDAITFHDEGEAMKKEDYFTFLAREVREYLAEIGVEKLDDIIGRTDLIIRRPDDSIKKHQLINFDKVLARVDNGAAIRHIINQQHGIDRVKDVEILNAAANAVDEQKEVSLEYTIANTDRACGAMLSGAIAAKYGAKGLPEHTLNVKFKGSAGQSFGAFLVPGINFKLEGEANDYLGKGLSGGRIAVLPPVRSNFEAEKNTIAGNTLLYGATSGEVYINGRVGERFAVRNSGAIAVVEGVGDHCCEYMTGGRVVVLGQTGRNFAAGMSGGVAYVWNKDGNFDYFCNMEMVELSLIEETSYRKELHELIRQHYLYTGSKLARILLDDWTHYVDEFIQVVPIEYKKVLQEEQMKKLQQKIADMQRDY